MVSKLVANLNRVSESTVLLSGSMQTAHFFCAVDETPHVQNKKRNKIEHEAEEIVLQTET